MFIQTESTPNPRTLKFLPGREVLGAGTREFADARAASASPLVQALFLVEGVERVYLGGDFITVTKADAVEWAHLKPHVLAAIMDHFNSGRPVLASTRSWRRTRVAACHHPFISARARLPISAPWQNGQAPSI